MNKVFNSRFSSGNDFYTPAWVTEMLLKYIPKSFNLIWEPACGLRHISRELEKAGKTVFSTDIKRYEADFLKWEHPYLHEVDCIITNPPFSIKGRWMQRCLDLQKPFALLLPIGSLEPNSKGYKNEKGDKATKGWDLPRDQILPAIPDLTIIIPNQRVAYINQPTSVNFCSAWFCSGFGLSKQIIFENVR